MDRTEQNREASSSEPLRVSEFLAAVTAEIQPTLRTAADNLYERILYFVQDYLTDNAEYNIGSRIKVAEREAANARCENIELAKSLLALRGAARALLYAFEPMEYDDDFGAERNGGPNPDDARRTYWARTEVVELLKALNGPAGSKASPAEDATRPQGAEGQ